MSIFYLEKHNVLIYHCCVLVNPHKLNFYPMGTNTLFHVTNFIKSMTRGTSISSCSYGLQLTINQLVNLSTILVLKHNYAGTSLSCAGIQLWKSVSFCCWAAINLVGERSKDTPPPTLPILFLPHCVKSSKCLLNEEQDTPPLPYPSFSFLTVWRVLNAYSMRSRTPHPLPYPPFSFLTAWRVLHEW